MADPIIVDVFVEGQAYKVDITNNIAFLGELVVNEIKTQIRTMKLITEGGGDYLQRWESKVEDEGFLIESGVDYSTYLEFGTFAFGALFGSEDWPATGWVSSFYY